MLVGPSTFYTAQSVRVDSSETSLRREIHPTEKGCAHVMEGMPRPAVSRVIFPPPLSRRDTETIQSRYRRCPSVVRALGRGVLLDSYSPHPVDRYCFVSRDSCV